MNSQRVYIAAGVMEIGSLIPGVGAIFDTVNVGLYASQKDWLNMGLSAVSAGLEFAQVAGVLVGSGKMIANAANDATHTIMDSIQSTSKSTSKTGVDVLDTLIDGGKMQTDDVLDVASKFLGDGYYEPVPGSGGFVSKDGKRVFKMGESNILGKHGSGSHVNFEILEPNPDNPGKMKVTKNIHIFLED